MPLFWPALVGKPDCFTRFSSKLLTIFAIIDAVGVTMISPGSRGEGEGTVLFAKRGATARSMAASIASKMLSIVPEAVTLSSGRSRQLT